jgi:dTDP-4-amino-4,6-dideoxygalactose transaminase
MSKKIQLPITRVELDNSIKAELADLIDSGWLVQGPKVKKLEDMWCNFTGAKHSIAVTSCTTAMHASLTALDIGIGDEVIVPAFTWIATANVVEHVGAKVVFCDIDTNTFNIDASKLESLITKKTKAIIPVHLFGLACEIDTITSIAKKYNLKVIEDAACGFSSFFEGKHVGNFGDTGCFSLHPRKAITTGEGGMITTNDDNLAIKLRSLRDHGAEMSDLQRHLGPKPYLLSSYKYAGYNFRMTDLQATVAIPQMHNANEQNVLRLSLSKKFNDLLDSIDWLSYPKVDNRYQHGYQSYVCLFSPEDINKNNIKNINILRNNFMEYLQNLDISPRPGTHAVHALEFYRKKYNIKENDYINAWIADQCSMRIPFFPTMNEKEFDYLANAITNYRF